MIKFDAKTTIIISDDLCADIWALLQEELPARAALVIDKNIAAQEDITKLVSWLRPKIDLEIHALEGREPTTDIVNEHTECLRKERIDFLIGVGGGSILDLTKALSVMIVNDGKIEDYHGTGRPFKTGIKKILVPTTAGTGSEVTPGAVLVNNATKFKRAISSKYVAAEYAVLNADLTFSLPDDVISSTGMDALGHAIESYTSRNANEITRMYSKKAFSLIYNNLVKVFDDKRNIAVRKDLLLGSCLAGYAICNSNTGAAHSMAYPLGIYNGVPHGLAVAYLLPKIVRINANRHCRLYADLYDEIDKAESIKDIDSKAEAFASLLENYKPLSYLYKRFADYGIKRDNYEFLAEKGLELKSALNNNPVDFNLNDAKMVLKELL